MGRGLNNSVTFIIKFFLFYLCGGVYMYEFNYQQMDNLKMLHQQIVTLTSRYYISCNSISEEERNTLSSEIDKLTGDFYKLIYSCEVE